MDGYFNGLGRFTGILDTTAAVELTRNAMGAPIDSSPPN